MYSGALSFAFLVVLSRSTLAFTQSPRSAVFGGLPGLPYSDCKHAEPCTKWKDTLAKVLGDTQAERVHTNVPFCFILMVLFTGLISSSQLKCGACE